MLIGQCAKLPGNLEFWRYIAQLTFFRRVWFKFSCDHQQISTWADQHIKPSVLHDVLPANFSILDSQFPPVSMKKLLILAIAILPFCVNAQTGPFWATDVAPIFYANCTKCHNPNGIAPFSLLTYSDAVAQGIDIQTDVTNRIMPPWPPDTAYHHFIGERILSPQEVQTIDDWVNNGMQQGNLSQAPTPPVYSGQSEIPVPDAMVQMPLYTVNTATDLYRCFVMPGGVPQNEFITKVEVLPGNRNIVHHVLVFQDTSNTCIGLDNADPGPGYTWFGDVGSSTATLVIGWVPGQGMWELPQNMGVKLLANSNIIIQVHYPGGTFGQVDSTQVRFTFSSGAVREVYLAPVINHSTSITNGPLYIPADSIKTFYAQEAVNYNVSVISVAPHMHLIGQTICSYAIDPMGDTIPMISIPDWSFHWQGFYNFQQPVHVPYGSTIKAYAMYDNTVNNPENPNNPPQDVWVGESTTDEMLVVYFAYLAYQFGDENIIIDSSLLASTPDVFPSIVQTPQLYNPYPVPATGNELHIEYFLPAAGVTTIELIDANGKVVRVIHSDRTGAGFNTAVIETAGLASGAYVIRLSNAGVTRTKTVVL